MLLGFAPTGQKGVPRKNRQVSESNAREIREDAGQAGKGSGPVETSSVHDHMPVILDPDSYDVWLDPGMTNVAGASELLKPYDARLMRCYP
jgi:SOS response associated peptidase (SRAP)